MKENKYKTLKDIMKYSRFYRERNELYALVGPCNHTVYERMSRYMTVLED